MKNQDKFITFLNKLFHTPEEYNKKFKVPLRTIYWQMEHKQLDYVKLKGKKLIINKNIDLKQLKDLL